MAKHLPTLSINQYNALKFIAMYIHDHGFQPLFSEVGAVAGVSEVSARKLIIKLESKGYLRRDNRKIVLLHVPGFPQISESQEWAA